MVSPPESWTSQVVPSFKSGRGCAKLGCVGDQPSSIRMQAFWWGGGQGWGEQDPCQEANLVLDRFLQKHPESFVSFGDGNYIVWEYCRCSFVCLSFQIGGGGSGQGL